MTFSSLNVIWERVPILGLPERVKLPFVMEYSPLIIFNNEVLPLLDEVANVKFIPRDAWSDDDREQLDSYFHESINPLLTPIALDIAHPFPHIHNKSLNYIIELKGKEKLEQLLSIGAK